jgi:hypothetical protein
MKKRIVVTVIVALMFGVGTGDAATIVESFQDLIPGVGAGENRSMHMDYGDNLMIRDPDTGVDSVVAKVGVWRLGLLEKVPGGYDFGAFANTDNAFSNGFSGYEGWMTGYAYDSVFSDGESPDGALLVFDPDGGQMALADAGELLFDANTFVYTSGIELAGAVGGIEFDGTIDDLSSIVFAFGPGDEVRISHLVAVIPEPATMALMFAGGLFLLRRRRRG